MEIQWRFVSEPAAQSHAGHDLPMALVLVVEDERDIRELLRRYLERAGHSVIVAETGAAALRQLEESAPELGLLDLGLPDIDGLEVLSQCQVLGIPAIALTARGSVDERILGLQAGADDYVAKPFSPQEVVLRVAAVLARSSKSGSEHSLTTFDGGRLLIDREGHRAVFDGVELDLTPTEWDLLVALSSRPSKAFSRAELVNRLRGFEFSAYERTIDSHVKNLRKKLAGGSVNFIETVQGLGYRFGVSADE